MHTIEESKGEERERERKRQQFLVQGIKVSKTDTKDMLLLE